MPLNPQLQRASRAPRPSGPMPKTSCVVSDETSAWRPHCRFDFRGMGCRTELMAFHRPAAPSLVIIVDTGLAAAGLCSRDTRRAAFWARVTYSTAARVWSVGIGRQPPA